MRFLYYFTNAIQQFWVKDINKTKLYTTWNALLRYNLSYNNCKKWICSSNNFDEHISF